LIPPGYFSNLHRNSATHFNVRFLIRLPIAVWALSFLLLGASAGAEDAKAGPESSHWGLGLGLGTERNLYKGISLKNVGLPLINFENRYVDSSATPWTSSCRRLDR
jgi:hypothetical protein